MHITTFTILIAMTAFGVAFIFLALTALSTGIFATCVQNCKTCVNGDMCTECDLNFVHPDCNEKCNSECRTCYSSASNCNGDCEPRSYGQSCQYNCPATCQECTSETTCTFCRTGSFNANDVTVCNCNVAACQTTSASGTCMSCTLSTWYPTGEGCCECGQNCVDRKCNQLGYCVEVCNSGYYGHRCDLLCSNKDVNCSLCAGEDEASYRCTQCLNDRMYLYTDPDASTSCLVCSENCYNGSCLRDGTCDKGCKTGYTGDKCDQATTALFWVGVGIGTVSLVGFVFFIVVEILA